DALGVECTRVRRGPRRVERDLLRDPVELPLRAGDGQHGQRAYLRDEPGVATDAVAVDEQVRALRPRLVRADADFRGERVDAIVVRRQPRATAVDRRAVGEGRSPDAAA